MMPLILHLPEVKKEAKIALEHVHDIGYVHGIVKTAISVNRGELKGAALEKAMAHRLRELLGGVAWLKDWQIEIVPMDDRRGSDINATLPLPNGGMAELWVVCKSNPRPHQIAYDRTQDFPSPQSKRQKRVWVLAAPFVSSRMSQLCQELRWSWFDLAGNCHLSVPDAFQIERTGQPPVHRLPKSGANLSTPEAARILRALLATDNAGRKWTQRDLQLHARPNVSIGLVNKVVRHLQDKKHHRLRESAQRGFRPNPPIWLRPLHETCLPNRRQRKARSWVA
ncbi:MAG TPA: hypothetical protein VMQ67_06110 [Candidatus Saccharimonadales bacterium]|nr:hypothetical protein [Candidatus Saccharimonadales bacterium]